jgi:5-(carboxyamino)imidazole ribonucleotide synthase
MATAAIGQRGGVAGMTILAPGSVIGILGGGQLGRMLAMAAAQLGYRSHIYAPEADSVAAEVAGAFTLAEYEDIAALTAFAKTCDVVTYEFENVPVEPLKKILGIAALRPGIAPLEIAQDRAAEKKFAADLAGNTAAYAIAASAAGLKKAIAQIGLPAIVKTNRMGYDGKGQIRLQSDANLNDVWDDLERQTLIVEGQVEFGAEFSVILVRGQNGEIRYYECPRNTHDHGILSQSTVPAGPLVESQIGAAQKLSAAIADALEYVGVLTCEFFAAQSGPIFNEMAPRVHNSGHWTIEGAVTSQFENHIRAICGLPLGDTTTNGERVEMQNLIGEDAGRWEKILSDPAAHLHLYGKGEAHPGRKMGHITRLYA